MPDGLRLIVHDFDVEEMRSRAQQLKRALPDAAVRGFATRRGLLEHVRSLPSPCPGLFPVCLIDLQHPDREDRGEHLIRTVDLHPLLTGRVALVAFTRFNHPHRTEALERIGARGLLSPLHVDDPQLRQWLVRVASGPSRVISFGEPPSTEEDMKFLARMAELFPYLTELDELDPTAALEEAVRILTICRLFHDGYDTPGVLALAQDLGCSTRGHVDTLRERLDPIKAYEIGAVKGTGGKIDLGAVIPAVARFDDRSSERVDHIALDRSKLDGLATIQWVQSVPLDRRDPTQDGAWAPPDYLPLLDRFVELHERERPKRHPSKQAMADASTRALEGVAAATGLSSDEVRERVVHAIACVANRTLDGACEDPAGGELF
jgi:hypothetical protein